MKLSKLVAAVSILVPTVLYADAVFRIEVGDNYDRYSDHDLRRRVWELERAVLQLQQKVFELQTNPVPDSKKWTCYIQVFNQTFSSTEATETAAKVAVMQTCSKKFTALHCQERIVKCGN